MKINSNIQLKVIKMLCKKEKIDILFEIFFHYFIFIIAFGVIQNTLGQTIETLPSFVPKTPNASELIRSIDYPINYSTGTAKISIPLSDIKVDNISLPIALNYNSRGFAKDTKEGVAGLGWTISNDLEITRITNGIDDFFKISSLGEYGYYYYDQGYGTYLNSCDDISNSSPTNSYYCEKGKYNFYYRGKVDTEPDKFYYSLLSGRSGAFYFQQRKSDSPNSSGVYTFSLEIVQWPYTGVKIELISVPNCSIEQNGEFKITDIDGTEYYYASTEINDPEPLTYSVSNQCALKVDERSYITSWKCYKIITGKKRERINIFYEKQLPMYSYSGEEYIQVHSNKRYYNSWPPPFIPSENDVFDLMKSFKTSNTNISMLSDGSYSTIIASSFSKYNPPYEHSDIFKYPLHYTKHTTGLGSAIVFPTGEDDLVIEEYSSNLRVPIRIRKQQRKRLYRIVFPEGSIDYNYHESGTETGQLSSITMYDKDSKVIKIVDFYQSTTGNDTHPDSNGYYRHYDGSTTYLDSLSMSSNGTSINHSFEYKNITAFKNYPPTKRTTESMDINFSTEEFSEINGRFSIGPEYREEPNNHFQYLSSTPYNSKTDRIVSDGMLQSITYPSKQTTVFNYEQNSAYAFTSGLIEDVEGFRISSILEYDKPIWINGVYNMSNTILRQRRFVYGRGEKGGGIMKPLRYHNDVPSVTENILSASLSQQALIDTNLNINNTPGYYYPPYYPTNYHSSTEHSEYIVSNNYNLPNQIKFPVLIKKEDVTTYKKNTFVDLPYGTGNPVYYDVVTEFQSYDSNDTHKTGKTVYTYNVIPENGFTIGNTTIFNSLITGNPDALVNEDYNWVYGHLVSKVDYKGILDRRDPKNLATIFKPVKELINTFKINAPIGNSHRIDYGRKHYNYSSNIEDILENFDFHTFQYHGNFFPPIPVIGGFTHTGYTTLETSKQTVYSDTGNIETTTFYEYDATTLLKKSSKIFDSQAETITNISYYPEDVTTKSSLGHDNLSNEEFEAIERLKKTDLHRLSEPVQVETYKNGVLMSTIRTNFHEPYTSILVSKDIQTSKGTAPLEDRIIYHKYDDKGNPVEISKKNGTHVVYIWGYNHSQPIAKIENASYFDVQNQVSNLQTLSNNDNDRTVDTKNSLGNIIAYNGKEGKLREALQDVRSALPNAQVTTYTYDPLIGVTSITDPKGYTIYYEYDEFNRLKQVKDADGNILSNNQYNYKN
jgi:YD repeat-containing protein